MLLGKQSRCSFEWPSAVVESGISPNVRSCQRRRRFGAASHVRSVVWCTDDDWQKANLFSTPSLNFLQGLSSQALLDVHLKMSHLLQRRDIIRVCKKSKNVHRRQWMSRLSRINVSTRVSRVRLHSSDVDWVSSVGLASRKLLRIPKAHRVSIDVNVLCCSLQAHWSILKHGTRSRHVPTTYTFSPCESD